MKPAYTLLAFPGIALAFPSMLGHPSGPSMMHKREAHNTDNLQKRQGLIPSVPSLVNDVEGILGSIASAVDPDNYRPEPGYDFQEPGPSDSRGPCPGLNLLANHGYLPRDGKVNFGQVVNATARGFNMATDLSTILSVFAVLTDGDIETESWYLGAGPDKVGGLNRHNTVEVDISPNREDFYLGCGDNHHLSSRLFKQNVALAAADPSRQFTQDVMGEQFAAGAKFSQQNNPYLSYFPFPSIVSFVAFAFYPQFFSNGTYLAGGVANYESISSIIGAKLNEKTGEFEYVPERWPEQGWYRRALPYEAVEALADGLEHIYSKYPIPMGVPQLGSDNLSVQTLLCNIYMGINSIEPLALAGEAESVTAGVTWALGKLAAVGISDTILGCPKNAISKNLDSNGTIASESLNPPKSVIRNSGNNVYHKTYFIDAPTKPQCSHTS